MNKPRHGDFPHMLLHGQTINNDCTAGDKDGSCRCNQCDELYQEHLALFGDTHSDDCPVLACVYERPRA